MIKKDLRCKLLLPLNEGVGEPHDSSGFVNTVANHGAIWQVGTYGRQMYFGGINDYVECGNDPRLLPDDHFTIGIWMKPETDQEYCYDGSEGNYGVAGSCDAPDTTSTWSWQLRYGSADACSLGLQVHTVAGSKWATLGENLPTDSWSYVAATFCPTATKICLNGVLKGSLGHAATTISNNANNILMFGVAGWGSSNTYANFTMGEGRFYDADLNVTEILAYYNSTKARYGL